MDIEQEFFFANSMVLYLTSYNKNYVNLACFTRLPNVHLHRSENQSRRIKIMNIRSRCAHPLAGVIRPFIWRGHRGFFEGPERR
ncbi:MAG: hypothetical protein PWP44_764 [Thermacetogenium sp.]|nr:hypothetical protein [Thermacetogenium sp.]